jgi:UDP:flavonoid glycosyltransferase YjiC (YdhE family)
MSVSAEPQPSRRRPRKANEPRRRVLFIGEGSTLAHAARPLALAAALPRDRYEVLLAAPERYRRWAPAHVGWRTLDAQTAEAFARRLSAGKPLFSAPRLEQYVADDLELIADFRPDVVVGDFRLSLAASARKAGVPYINISNAYWSPDRPLRLIRPPSLSLFKGWPSPLAELAFKMLSPSAQRWHARPIDQLLIAHGLPGVGQDVRRAFTEADLTLYADLPALFPDIVETEQRAFLGPVSWEPPTPLPDWWSSTPDERPIAYVSLGSSGDVSLIGRITQWLGEMGFTTLLATAERAEPPARSEALYVADYLPGLLACERADIVVCNGGSPGATQALIKGRPVLGVASNVDQLLNMRAVQATGAGAFLRADRLGRRAFENAVNRLSGFRASKAAAAVAQDAAGRDPARVLSEAIERLAPG